MKTKTRMTFAALFAIGLQAQAVTVSNVQAVQDWPWSTRIRVTYTLSGVTEAVGIEVALYDGETALDAKQANATIVGDFVGIAANGDYSLSFDCTEAFDGVRRLLPNFKVRLSPVKLHPGYDFPLYKVYDLSTGACEDMTPKKILSGAYGSYKWVEGLPVGAALSPLTNLVWTGVAEDDKYRTTHLVLRYLAAKGDYAYKLGYPSDKRAMPDDFYIAVFETTQAQWANVTGDSHTWQFSDAQGRKPADNVSYNAIRGRAKVEDDTPFYYYPLAPDPDSFLGKLRDKTSVAFDLPAQFEWNFAWHAYSAPNSLGTSAGEPAEWSDGTSYADCEPPAQYKKATSVGTAIVGSYAPSKAGLYDLYGNVCEWCADFGCSLQGGWRNWPAKSNVDPGDPTTFDSSFANGSAAHRPVFGGSYNVSTKVDLLLNGGEARGMKTPDTTSYKVAGDLGFRVVTPCSETVGTPEMLVGGVYGESAAVEVFTRPDDTYTWRTAPVGDFTVSWFFPRGASSATLRVEGIGYSQTYANLSTTSQALALPAATRESENVYSLTLTFDNGVVQTATLGRIRGAVLGNAATVHYAPLDSSAWHRAWRANVLAVLPGATSLSVDGGEAISVVGAGYQAWTCLGRQEHTLVLSAEEDVSYTATLRLGKGTLFIFR